MLQALSEANGSAAASLAVAEKYVSAFGELAKEQTHQLFPAFASLFHFFLVFTSLDELATVKASFITYLSYPKGGRPF
jgi:hypothetical protein